MNSTKYAILDTVAKDGTVTKSRLAPENRATRRFMRKVRRRQARAGRLFFRVPG